MSSARRSGWSSGTKGYASSTRASRARRQRLGEKERASGSHGGPREVAEHERQEVLVGVARREARAADAPGVIGARQLAERPAGVVADERHSVEIERGQEIRDDAREARGTQVRVDAHRGSMRSERPVRDDAAKSIAQ